MSEGRGKTHGTARNEQISGLYSLLIEKNFLKDEYAYSEPKRSYEVSRGTGV